LPIFVICLPITYEHKSTSLVIMANISCSLANRTLQKQRKWLW